MQLQDSHSTSADAAKAVLQFVLRMWNERDPRQTVVLLDAPQLCKAANVNMPPIFGYAGDSKVMIGGREMRVAEIKPLNLGWIADFWSRILEGLPAGLVLNEDPDDVQIRMMSLG